MMNGFDKKYSILLINSGYISVNWKWFWLKSERCRLWELIVSVMFGIIEYFKLLDVFFV